MEEQATCHKWDIEQERWMHNTLSGPEIILAGEWPCDCYCPTCGKKLNWDGSMTTMVPAVTPEAVAATRLYDLLDAASSNLPQGSLPHGELDALVTLGLVDGSDPHAAVPLTEQGRTIHAALAAGEPQQPSGVRQLQPGWFLGVDCGLDREAWTLLRTQPDGTHKVVASGYIEQATGGKE